MTPSPSLYAFHSDTSSPQFPLASLYLLHDYSTKSRNSASHTRVSSYRYIMQTWYNYLIHSALS